MSGFALLGIFYMFGLFKEISVIQVSVCLMGGVLFSLSSMKATKKQYKKNKRLLEGNKGQGTRDKV
jgi:hypothetical protein